MIWSPRMRTHKQDKRGPCRGEKFKLKSLQPSSHSRAPEVSRDRAASEEGRPEVFFGATLFMGIRYLAASRTGHSMREMQVPLEP